VILSGGSGLWRSQPRLDVLHTTKSDGTTATVSSVEPIIPVSVAKPIDFCALAPAPLTPVGIKRVIGKKKLHLVVRTDDDVSMNYHAHLHRKSSARQSLWTAIRISLRALETEQNSWTVYLARPNCVVLFLGRAHHEWDEVVADMKIFAGMKILGSVGRPNYSN